MTTKKGATTRKTSLVALVAVLLVTATPGLAQIAGVWQGEGSGTAYPPNHPPIHPWQSWEGLVENGAFDGSWWDNVGNYGDFHGGIIYFYTPVEPPSHTFAHCEGIWTWVSSEGTIPIEMGPFSMEFNLDLETCEGEWSSCANSEFGTMWGWRIGD